MEKVIVVGCNHAGTHTVTTILENFKDNVEVKVYDRNTNISFLGCGMALWIGNVIDGAEGLFYANPEMLTNLGADLKMEHELVSVDFKNKKIIVRDLTTNEEFEDNYDKLVLGLGSWPILPPIPGHDLENIGYAKLFQNAEEIIEKIKNPEIKDIVVVGAGYIGVELAESFVQNGKNVTLINDVEVLNRYYDKEFQLQMNERLQKNGVNCQIGELVTEFKGDKKVEKVITDKGEYSADLVLMSIGFKPNTDILKGTELELNERGAIISNENQETNIKDVYAIGDCTIVTNNATKQKQHIALATNAVRTGIVAGLNVGGVPAQMQGVQGSNAIHIFGLTLCSTGITESVAKEMGIEVDSVMVEDNLRPEFMPKNNKVTLKIVWEKESKKIIGAQMMSDEDISLALHMFSLAIQEELTIDKLALVDLFFLPHFNKPHNFITTAGLEALKKL